VYDAGVALRDPAGGSGQGEVEGGGRWKGKSDDDASSVVAPARGQQGVRWLLVAVVMRMRSYPECFNLILVLQA